MVLALIVVPPFPSYPTIFQLTLVISNHGLEMMLRNVAIRTVPFWCIRKVTDESRY